MYARTLIEAGIHMQVSLIVDRFTEAFDADG